MFSSPLRRAITRGMKPEGDLADELGTLDDYSVRSRKDAKAICDALSRLPLQSSGNCVVSSPLHALTALFQDVDGHDSPAFDVLYDEGLPLLIRIFDAKVEQDDERDSDDLLFVLKILAMYGSREGAEKIVEAARRPLKADAYMWHVILSIFSREHPYREFVFDALSDPLPINFLAVALLDSANDAAIKGDLVRHPFDAPPGWKCLRHWLEDQTPENFSYAHSATASIPFMSDSSRDQLLALAIDHIDAGVQMEAAWAAGKLGREAELELLARYCLDVNHSDVARRYLTELHRDDLVPPEASEPSFQAQAEFARWLAHPNELGQPPDELEIIDHRLLAWPPERELKPFWLIRYHLSDRTGLEEDQIDCGLVGSATWCFFSYKMHERPPEDAYAIHCYWEMEHAGLIYEIDATDPSEYSGMLGQWQGGRLQEPVVTQVAELSPQLKYPARLVGLATARRDGEEGWVVLDGPRSTWYPKAEQPAETHEGLVLKIHVGRQLLGFQGEPDRKKHLITDPSRPNPQQIVTGYEKILAEAAAGAPEQQQELLGNWGLLNRHFNAYVEALAAIHDTPKSDVVMATYDRFLQTTEHADEPTREKAYDSFGVLGEHFDAYVQALVAHGRSAEIAALIDLFAPHWDHNLGYGRLGTAAFRARRRDTAEHYFLKLRDGMEDYHRSEEMSMLAEIWHDRSEVAAARELLVDCMRKLITEIETSKYNGDRKTFAEDFQHHRATFLRLFPGSEPELAKLGIPAQPL